MSVRETISWETHYKKKFDILFPSVFWSLLFTLNTTSLLSPASVWLDGVISACVETTKL